ncbi:MAG: MurR/RpiR family transcriptional regulator [Oscillospiraceae bacterium]|nr:MurR/RpiR family transcriptional regulator [Oscillospiraceae bacterium]
MDFQKNLSARYNSLTKQGRRLADFICENQAKSIRMTAKSLGEASNTSAATVIRLSHQLGYESFEMMKISLAKDSVGDELNAPMDTIISDGDSVPDIVQKLYRNRLEALSATMALMDYADIKKTITLIQKARKIYLFGVGSSGLIAQEFCNRLNRIGKVCIFLSDSHTNLQYASVIDRGDLVIGFSYSGETKEVYLAAENAFKRGIPVIAVTRNRANSLSAWANITLTIPDIEKRVRVGSLTSAMSQMFIVDILYMSLLQKDFNKYESKLVETARIVNQLRE